MRISLVIPTHNRCDLLRRCLRAATTQTYPDYEVIVVDDASTDQTGDMVQREFPQVRYLRLECNRGPAAARNAGIAIASGEVIAFTDDDCEPDRGWLCELAQGFISFPQAGAVGGIQEAPEAVYQHNLLARYERHVTRNLYGLGTDPVVGSPAPGGGTNNLAVKAHILLQLRGFDETFPVAAGEDADLLRRLADLGYLTVCLPVKVTHHQPYTWASFIRQQIRRGIGAAYFHHKHGGMPSLGRDLLRLLAAPVLFVRDSVRFGSARIALVHAIAGVCQALGRIRARRTLSTSEASRSRITG